MTALAQSVRSLGFAVGEGQGFVLRDEGRHPRPVHQGTRLKPAVRQAVRHVVPELEPLSLPRAGSLVLGDGKVHVGFEHLARGDALELCDFANAAHALRIEGHARG